jgi:hypothetical protein
LLISQRSTSPTIETLNTIFSPSGDYGDLLHRLGVVPDHPLVSLLHFPQTETVSAFVQIQRSDGPELAR